MNPVTNAHVKIIQELQKDADKVKVMPVVFRDKDKEINTRSFPFDFNTREAMLDAVFGDKITVTDDYAFYAPFKKYMPPLFSPKSWQLRKRILNDVKGKDFFSYTGDRAEGYMLKMYRLKPKIGKRKPLSATSVKDAMYDAALGHESEWEGDVPQGVIKIIQANWKMIERFAQTADTTTRVAGMKFPKEGWSTK